MDQVNLEGLSSLEFLRLKLSSVRILTLKNLNELKHLEFIASEYTNNIEISHFAKLESFIFENDILQFNLNTTQKLLKINFLKEFENNIDLSLIYIYCDKIQRLWVNRSSIYTISKLLSGNRFPNLFEMDISNCNMNIIEKKLFNESLQILRLSLNSFSVIEFDSFSSLKQLVSLDFSSNSIESLDKRIFFNLDNLESLNLSNNRLKLLDEKIFSNLKRLKNLDLSCNQLEILDPNLFLGLENLNILYLSNNNLRYFEDGIFNSLPLIEKIFLSGNSIDKKYIEIMKGSVKSLKSVKMFCEFSK